MIVGDCDNNDMTNVSFLLPRLLHWGLVCTLPTDNCWNYNIDVDANHDSNVIKIINMIHTEGGVYNVERAAALVLDTDSHFHHSRYLSAGKKDSKPPKLVTPQTLT